MKGPTKQAAAVLFCLIFPVLLAFPAAAANDGPYYPIRVENPDGLKLFFVRSDIRDGGLLVFGHVRRSRLPGLFASAIRVSITGLDGNIIAEKSVTYAPRALSRHQVHNDARFYARFDTVPESGAMIRVSGQK
ncbi:MAG: hypothetical protein ACQERN_06765 [Thermodesulfobacteriota bacterium]